MYMYMNPVGLEALRAKLITRAAEVNYMLTERALNVVEGLTDELSMNAPIGNGFMESEAPPGDEPGKLFESFHWDALGIGSPTVVAAVRTTQPLKLKWVRYGTGIYGPLNHRIYPVRARALYWLGAPHPYRSIAGMKPYDFVTPAIFSAQASAGIEMLLMQREFLSTLEF